MGANAQTAVPAFTAGQVLTAAQQTQINTGIPVFATTTTRDAAFGGTGEKTLAEGQFAYIEASNTTQYYDGAAWQTVGGGFVRVGGATFSAVASVEFANDLFTSAYNIYYVAMNITSSSGNQTLSLRVRNNSGPVTGANYTGQTYMIRATDGTLSTNNTSSATSQVIGRASTVTTPIGLYVANPTSATIRTAWWGQGAQRDSNGDVAANTISGQYTVDEAHTGLNFFVAGTMTGSYNVYGLAES